MLKKMLPDLLVGLIAFLIGALLTILVHNYYIDLKGPIFGEPITDANYPLLDSIFREIPFVAGGLVSGLIAGIGYWRSGFRLIVRFLSGPALLYLVIFFHFWGHRDLASNELSWLNSLFVTWVLIGFLFSAVLSGMYFQLYLWERLEN